MNANTYANRCPLATAATSAFGLFAKVACAAGLGWFVFTMVTTVAALGV